MLRSGSLIAGLGAAAIIVGLLDSSLDSGILFAAGGIMFVCGLALTVGGVLVRTKQKQLMGQMQELQGGAGTFTGPTDATAILKSVMEAQRQSGGDPEKLAQMLHDQFGGGEATVIEGGEMTVIGPGAGISAGGADPVELLTQLSELRDKGVLTDEQFEQQKKRLLG